MLRWPDPGLEAGAVAEEVRSSKLAVSVLCPGPTESNFGRVARGEKERLKTVGKMTSREVADACLQYWGGMGFMDETPISRSYRDGRLGSIGGGADEVMLGIIAKYMGTLPGRK